MTLGTVLALATVLVFALFTWRFILLQLPGRLSATLYAALGLLWIADVVYFFAVIAP